MMAVTATEYRFVTKTIDLGQGWIMQFLDDGSASVTHSGKNRSIYLPPAKPR